MTESAKCPVCKLKHYAPKVKECWRCGYVFNIDDVFFCPERIQNDDGGE